MVPNMKFILKSCFGSILVLCVLLSSETFAGKRKLEDFENKVCFSPNEICDTLLEKFIGSAQESLDIAIYSLTSENITNAIIQAAKKINVRVVVDKLQSKGTHSTTQQLVDAGIDVRIGNQKGIMHNKFTILDDSMIETGSFNYTESATLRNNENQIYLATPSIVRTFKNQFEKIWREAHKYESEQKK